MSKRSLFLFIFCVAVLLTVTSIPINSLDPGQNQDEDLVLTVGRNVNMVSGTTLPGGDPYLQRQNEPSIAASTRNPLHLLAGANDYRTVDMPIEGEELPGVEDKIAAGDAWLGVFKSLDGGQSWTSTLLPGFPQDNSPEGLASPLKGYRAAADPVVRAGTNGLFYYSGIVFNRDTFEGAVFVSRFIDNNNEESGDPIKYVDTIIVDQRNGGVRFKDKPWIAVDVPKSSPPTITIDGQTIPCGNVYLAYSVFEGEEDDLESEIVFRRSTDCGTTWEDPIVLSTGHILNQGASVAVDPKGTEKVYVAWRRFEKGEQENAIVIALSENSGKSFHVCLDVATIPSYNSFDQPSSSDDDWDIPGTAFRTNSYPTLALDNKGHAYLAWSQRDGDPTGPARIVIATSEDGIYWSSPTYVEIPEEPSHQLMPSMTFASGKLMLVWYDLRNDYAMYWSQWIADFYLFSQLRHTIDVRIAQAEPSMTPVFEPSKQVSRYIYHFYEDPEEPGSWIAYQGQFNPPNFPLFKGGTLPFMGDYIDITPSPMFVMDKNGHWRFNIEPSDTSVFHVAWTDNRDVRPPWDHDWTKYTPPVSNQPSEFITDPSLWPYCSEGKNRPGMRNQNIYTSRITQGVEIGAPTNSKPLNLDVPRAFSIFVKNTTEYIRSFRLTIAEQPPDGQASFLQFDYRDEIDATIAPYSTIARPVFIESSNPNASVRIDVVEIDEPGGTVIPDGLSSFILINSDPSNPEGTGDIQIKEEHKVSIGAPDVIYWSPHARNQDVYNPHPRNWDVINPDIVTPHPRNLDIVNPSVLDPGILDLTNPHPRNPHPRNVSFLNPHARNPHPRNYSPEEVSIVDIEWVVKNEGNTTSSYTFKTISKESPPEGIYLQLLVYKEHFTPGLDGSSCELKQEVHHELIANILNPHPRNPHARNLNILDPEILNSDIENATFSIPPGEEVHVILRVLDTGPPVQLMRGLSSRTIQALTAARSVKFTSFIEGLGCSATSQGVDSEDVEQGEEEPEAAATILVIGTSSPLPEGTLDEFYSKEMTALGGTEPYEWWVDRTKLPPGLDLNENTGELYGTPVRDEEETYPETYSFTIQVTDSTLPDNQTSSQSYSLTIKEPYIPPPPLEITTESLPPGALNTSYNFGLEASGGAPAYHWSVVSGSLPDGLTLFDDGLISGSPDRDDLLTYPVTYSFTVQVTDSDEVVLHTATRDLSIEITEDTFTISGLVSFNGSLLPDVVMLGLPNTPITDENGLYTDTVAKGWSGTAEPSKAGYYFDPDHEDYINVEQNITTNYTAHLLTYTISGSVTYNNAPLPGVVLNGLPGNPETDENGYYEAFAEHGTSWTATPTLNGYTFDPATRNYESVTFNRVNQDYAASIEEGVDDQYEENDDWDNAYDITSVTFPILNLRLLDDDWFKINISDGSDLKVSIQGTFPENIDIEIYDALNPTRPLIAGICAEENETVHISDAQPGDYYIHIPYWKSEGLQNEYSLLVKTGDFGLGEIAGTITDETQTTGIEARVEIRNLYGLRLWHTFSDTDGDYRISLPPEEFKVLFSTRPSGDYEGVNYLGEWFENKATFSRGGIVAVQPDISTPVDAQLADGGVISGTVTDSDGFGVDGASVVVFGPEGDSGSYAYTDENGSYTVYRIPTGNYKVRIRPRRSGSHALQWYGGRNSFEDGLTVPVQAGETTPGIDAVLFDEGYVEGRVTDTNGIALGNVRVDIYDISQQILISSSWTDANGDYIVDRIPTGDFKMYFSPRDPDANHVSEWYADMLDFDEATPVSAQAGETTFGIDVELAEGGTVSGRVTDVNGEGLYHVLAYVFDLEGHPLRYAYTDENGDYSVTRVRPGDLRIKFRPVVGTNGTEWYDSKDSYNEADSISVQPNQTTSDINAQLIEGAYISGQVTNTAGFGIEGILVSAYDESQHFIVSYSVTDTEGNYTIPRIPSGRVKVFFNANYTDYVSEWHRDRDSFESGQLVTTTVGQITSGIDAELESKPDLSIITTSLPDGPAGEPYTAVLEATGGTEFYFWRLADGSSLPEGLTLDSNGIITGTPTVADDYFFTVEVIDSSSPQKSDSQTIDLSITSYAGTGLVISGTVAIGGVIPLEGVLIELSSGNSTTTNVDGFYTFTVDYDWSGTATPSLSGYTFNPVFREYINVTSDQANHDYTAISPNYTVSGTVTVDGVPLPGVDINVLPGDSVITDENGFYSATVDHGWTGTITPTLAGYAFDPPSREYTSVSYSLENQDFTTFMDQEFDDSYEENDDMGNAAPISLGTTHNLRLLDNDCFIVNVSGGPDLKVTVNGVLSRDMDVEIYDDSGNQLTGGISGSRSETVYLSDVAPGDYTIVVPYWRNEGLQNAYSLTVDTGDFGLGEINGVVVENPLGPGIVVRVDIYDLNNPKRWHTFTREDGSYGISLLPGDYRIFFDTRPWNYFPYEYEGLNYVNEWYNKKVTSSRATVLSIQADQTLSDINAILIQGSTITGRITDTEGNGLEGILVRDWAADGRTLSYAYTDENGNYSLERLPRGNFKVRVRPPWGTYAVEWYNDESSFEEGDTVRVGFGSTTSDIDVVLEEGGFIEGRVTDVNGSGINNVAVEVYDKTRSIFYSRGWTDENGYYSASHMPTADVKVFFDAGSTSANFVSEWYEDKSNFNEATLVSVQAGGTTFDIDAVLEVGGYIEGRVIDPNGEGLYRIQVNVFDLEGHGLRSRNTDENGDYTLSRVRPGDVKVRFRPNTGTYAVEWYNDKSSYFEADSASIVSNQTTTDINAQLVEGGYISGQVTNTKAEGIEGVLVVARDDTQNFTIAYSVTDENGNYTVPRMPGGNVKVFFNANYTDYVSEWYNDQDSFETAELVPTVSGNTIPDIDAILEKKPPLIITTESLPVGELGVEYSANLEVTGGNEFYYWYLDSSFLPNGLTLDSKGHISGIPTAEGTYTFFVYVFDSPPYPNPNVPNPTILNPKELSITINPYTGPDILISGTVSDGSPVPGVVIEGLPGNPTTNLQGEYVVTVPAGWSGTAIPTLAGYAFDPYSREYTNVISHMPQQDYIATAPYAISGTVFQNGSPVQGVMMAGLPGDPATTEQGEYTGIVHEGWSGTVTPTLIGFTFDPESTPYTNVTSDVLDQNYTATFEGGVDDGFEPNDDMASAQEITEGTYTNLVFLNEDWYKIFIPAESVGKDLKVHVKGIAYPDPNRGGDLDFGIFDSSGKLLGYVLSSSDDETLFITDLTEGWYTIGLNYFSQEGAVYSLTTEVGDNFGIGYVSGRVTDEQGQGIGNIFVELYGEPFDWANNRPLITTDSEGYYKIGFFPGDYTVRFNLVSLEQYYPDLFSDPNYIGEYYDNWPSSAGATVLSVGAGATIEGINAELAQGGTISGRVIDPEGSGEENVFVSVYDSDEIRIAYVYTEEIGNYTLKRIPTGNYKVRFRPVYENYATEWYEDKGTFEEAHPVPVQAGSITSNINVQLVESGSLEGRVTNSIGDPLQNVRVYVYGLEGLSIIVGNTDEDGYYRIDRRLPSGEVAVFFNASYTGENYVSEYYTDKLLLEEANPVSIQAGQTTSGIDAQLAEGGTISGRVTDSSDNGLVNIVVACANLNSRKWYSTSTDEDGNYTINRIHPDDYRVRFLASLGDYATEWFDDGSSFADGDTVTIGEGQTLSDINAQLADNGGYITGQVTDIYGAGIEGVRVFARDSTKEATISWVYTDADGNYTLPRIPTCEAKVYFDADYFRLNYISEWNSDKATYEYADVIQVNLGETTPGINAALAERPNLAVNTSSLPRGELAAPYMATLEASGGREFYHWSLDSGMLPNGLVLESSGVISGVPTSIGTYSFTVLVSDSSRSQQFSLKNLSIAIDTYAGTDYLISGTVTLFGAPLPGVFMRGLPGNPVTNANGEYVTAVTPDWSGTVIPTKPGYYFDPRSMNYSSVYSHYLDQNYDAYVLTLNITTPWLLNGTEDSPFSQTLEAAEGIEPYTWSLASGSLPYGLALDSDGLISGTPTASDTYEFTVQVTDSSTLPQYVEKEFTFTIHNEGNISEAPILYWKLNEGEGNTTQDSSGYGIHGNLNENATYTDDAVEGWAVEMSGQGWISRSGEGNFYFADEATVMAYVKIDDFNQESRFIWKLQYDHPVLGHPYSLEVGLSMNESILNLWSANGLKESVYDCEQFTTQVDLSDPANGFDVSEYNHIAVAIKDDVYKIFINGEEVASEPGAVFEINDNAQCFWVGGANWSDFFLEGKVDEIIVYNRGLTLLEVDELYQAGPMFLISGTVSLNGSPLQGIWMEGLPGGPWTNDNGEYIAPVLPGWSGTISPVWDGYYFSPVSRSYEDVMENHTGQDFTAYESGSLRIYPSRLPDGIINSSYSANLSAYSGNEPYTFSIIGGFLPDGLTLNPDNGEISGAPTEAGDFSFTAQVIDSSSPQQAARRDVSLSISPNHQGFWTTTYPFGGNMHAQGLAIDSADSDVIFATAENRGIFKSSDAGSSWINIIEDPDWPFWETDYGMFRIHQSTGNYYIASGRGIYQSSDRGGNWETIYERENWDISTFTVDPTSTDIIYVGTWGEGMYKTEDSGASWFACSSGLPSESLRTIAIDPNSSSTVYVGTFNSGIFKSSDSGNNWLPINNNIDFQRVEDIVIDPNNSDIIYLASWYEFDQGLFRSIDGGGSWEILKYANVNGGGLGDYIAIDPTDSNTLYFSSDQPLFKSIDGGSNWTEYSVSSSGTRSIIIDPSDSQTLYAATHGEGVYKSENGGLNWTPVNNGIRALSFPDVGHSLEFDESNPNTIYAGSLGGGYRSLDRGATWEKMDFPQGSMTAILTHPDTEGTVYAVFNSFWISPGNGSSGSWVDPTVPQFCCVPRMDLGIASDDPDVLYFTVKHSDDPQSGIYRSDDGGVTWTLKNNGLTHTDVRAIAVHPTDHQVVFAGTEWEWPLDPNKDYGLYKTIDGGENWNYISCGFPSGMYIHQILIYPGDPNTLYLIGGGEDFCGLFKSEDGGECWEQVSNNCANSIAIAPDNPDLLYFGHWEGFNVSLNGGSSWMEFNGGLPRNPQVNSIHLDPTDPFHVFIGTGAGVYEATFSFDFMITTEWLPMGIINEAYSATLGIHGGTPPISWEIVSGSLPNGLALDQNTGEISGIPIATGSFDFIAKATDDTGLSYTRQMNITVSQKYLLNVTANPTEGGGVSKNPDESVYIEGDMVDVSLDYINPGYTFTGWSGDASGTAHLVHAQMTRDKNITANFALTVDLPDYYVDYYNAPSQADTGENVGSSVGVRVGNNGGNDAFPEEISVGVYISTDPHITTSDILLWKGRASITALNSGETAFVTFDPEMTIPTTISAGGYHIGALIDDSNVVDERDENNNYSSRWINITSPGPGHLELLGGWAYGAAYAHTVDEARNLSIIGHGGTLQVLDVSDPSNPTLMGELSLAPSSVNTMKIVGNNVFVANGGGGLKVVDISNPYNPFLIGSCDAIQSARSLDISGNYAYVTDYHQGLRIIDISNPVSPFQTAFLPLPGRNRLIAASGNYVHITRGYALNEQVGESGVRIVDVSNPYNPIERALIQPIGATQEIDVDNSGQFLFVGTSGNYLRIYDVSDPDAPFEIASYEGMRYASGVTIVEYNAYVVDGRENRIAILDISDIYNITEVSSYWFEDSVNLMHAEVAGNLCIVNSWFESLRIVDFSDFNSPQEVGSYDIVGLLNFVDVDDDHAYVVNSRYGNRDGLKILDLSNLSDIKETATTATPYNLYGVKVSEGHAYLPAWDNGLRALAISDPSNPLEVGAYEDLERAQDIVISGKYAYLADGSDGLRVFDISLPSNPELVSTCRTEGNVYQVAVSGNYAYLAANWGGLRIVDISDPMNPWEVGSYEFDGRAYYVGASGDYAYVHDRYETLRIIDVSNPENPFEVSQFGLYLAWGDIAISGNLIFVPDWIWGVRVIDVSNPYNPTEIEVYNEVSTIEEVIIRENLIYVVNRDAGIYVFEYRAPGPEQTISGKVVLDGSALQGVLLDGLPDETTTNELGEYSATVSTGWTGAVTPRLAGHIFVPSNRFYNNIASDQLNQNYTSLVGDPLQITTTWLNDGTVDLAYSETLEATGGTTPYFWDGVSGSVPEGLNLDTNTGEISGTPTEPGDYSFTIQVVDSGSPPQSALQEFSLRILNTYTLQADVSPGGGGSVTKNPDKARYAEGEVVELTATPNPGFTFAEWSSDASGGTNPLNVPMLHDKYITANFALTVDLPDYSIDSFSAPSSVDAGEVIGGEVSLSVQNQGADDFYPGSISVGIYLSPDSVITKSDITLWEGKLAIMALGSGETISVGIDPELQIPNTVAAGDYYIGVLVDETGVIIEQDENNNYSSQSISLASIGEGSFEIVGSWSGGATYGLAVDEARNLVLIGHGGDLEIWDFSDPSSLVKRSDLFLSSSLGVCIVTAGNYVYIADGGAGLKVVDFSDPDNPVEIGSCETFQSSARSVDVSGDYAYVTDYHHGLRVIDISTPSSPTEVAFIPFPYLTREVNVFGDYAYVSVRVHLGGGEGEPALRIIDISDPENPVLRSTTEFPSAVMIPAMDDSGQYLFVPIAGNGVKILDVSNPDAPFEVASYDGVTSPTEVMIKGNMAYVDDNQDDHVVILDISDVLNPVEVSSYWIDDNQALYGFEVAGNLWFVNRWYDSIKILDFSDLNAPYEVGSYDDTEGMSYYLEVSDDHAYLINNKSYTDRIKVLDVSDLSNITETTTFETPYSIYEMDMSGDHVYLAAWNDGLITVDITDPSNLVQTAAYEEHLQQVRDVIISGNYAYVARGWGGLRIVDISVPTNPNLISYLQTPGYAWTLALQENYLYIANHRNGLRIVDVSDPLNPWEVGAIEFEDNRIRRVAVSGNYAYVTEEYKTIRVIDVSDPANPAEVSSFETYYPLTKPVISGHLLFVSDWLLGLRVMDVSDPYNPTQVALLNEIFGAEQVAIRDNYIYALNRDSGLYVLEFKIQSP